MQVDSFPAYWEHAAPLMKSKLGGVKNFIEAHWAPRVPTLSVQDVYETADDDLAVHLDLFQNEALAIAVSFNLIDAEEADLETGGVAVVINVVDASGHVIGTYAPHNFSDDVFTTDKEEVSRRINNLGAGDFVAFLMDGPWHKRKQ